MSTPTIHFTLADGEKLVRIDSIRSLRLKHRPVFGVWAVVVDGASVFEGSIEEATNRYDDLAEIICGEIPSVSC